jgi:hypothetical protein
MESDPLVNLYLLDHYHWLYPNQRFCIRRQLGDVYIA